MKITSLHLFLSFLVTIPLAQCYAQSSQKKKTGYALIVCVPQVNNETLKKKYDLSKDINFDILPGTIKDGDRIKRILTLEGFPPSNISRLGNNVSDKITAQQIIDEIKRIEALVVEDDLFVFYYAGHGFQVPDEHDGDEKKNDSMDEVFVTYDSFLKDDLFNSLFKKNFKNTRNLVLVDACHSGSLYQLNNTLRFTQTSFTSEKGASLQNCNIRSETNIDESFPMIYYGSAIDPNQSYDNGSGGYFTRALESLYNQYWRSYNYSRMACQISNRMRALNDDGKGLIQYAEIGNPKTAFKTQYLFKIN